MPCVRSTIPHQIGILTIEAVQLIGRWGSDAIKRYIQEAPLQLQHVANRRAQRDDQPTSPEPSPTRGPSPPAPVLDLQPHDQGMPRTGSSRNMH